MRILVILIIIIGSISCNYKGEIENKPKSKEIIRIMFRSYDYQCLSQIEIDITNQTLKYRKDTDKEFEFLGSYDLARYFVDSVNYDRMIEIVDAYASENKENLCDFHNEKGYLVVDLIKRGFEYDAILSTTFIINQPYRCKINSDDILIQTFYNKLTDLINSKD